MNISEGAKKAYTAAAEKPEEAHPFPVGRCFAESVGYPKELLDQIPTGAAGSFAGVSNVSIFAYIPAGSTVLDPGCGSGLDSIIAAEKTGPSGKVIGIDFSDAMISSARHAVFHAGFSNVIILRKSKNERTKNPRLEAADICAMKYSVVNKAGSCPMSVMLKLMNIAPPGRS